MKKTESYTYDSSLYDRMKTDFLYGSYSKLIKPILFVTDLLWIGFLHSMILSKNSTDLYFLILTWSFLALIVPIYSIYRYTQTVKIFSLFAKQISLLILVMVTYYYVVGRNIPITSIIVFLSALFISLNVWRLIVHELFKKYRMLSGRNTKKVVIVGVSQASRKLERFFRDSPEFGYRFQGFFGAQHKDSEIASIDESFDFILKNNIEEVYCSIKELNKNQIENFIAFCDENFKTLKFIAEDKELFSKNLQLDYYDLNPIITIRATPLDDPLNFFIKRFFDIGFSLLVIVFLLSWLVPLIGIIIKLESKGPVFFKQNRPGIKEQGFGCYKFRSMYLNQNTEDSATINDPRITKVGKFIRKTSIDELPQFFNVLYGSMSVVGPRPHLWRQNKEYSPSIQKYMFRHYVKPGITGLAQVMGYRGEILTKHDIVNRTRYDIFYIENWSILLDLRIMVKTIINFFKGEEKAY